MFLVRIVDITKNKIKIFVAVRCNFKIVCRLNPWQTLHEIRDALASTTWRLEIVFNHQSTHFGFTSNCVIAPSAKVPAMMCFGFLPLNKEFTISTKF